MLVTMSDKELVRAQVIQSVCEKRLRRRDAASRLDLSERQVQRLMDKFRVSGTPGLASLKRGKPGNHNLPEQLRMKVLALLRENYSDFGPTLAAEKLSERHQITISTETVRHWMIADGLWVPHARRKARVYQPRYRRDCLGELIQIDGSHHDWFEGRASKCCLLVYIDDATGRLMHLRFCETESAFDYMLATREYLDKHGKPVAFYSDKHAVFRVSQAETRRTGTTQFGRVLDDLNIELICANSSQAKGRVERANLTLQDRLIKKMRIESINSIEETNTWLDSFIQDFNHRFAKAPNYPKNLHRSSGSLTRRKEKVSILGRTWRIRMTVVLQLPHQQAAVVEHRDQRVASEQGCAMFFFTHQLTRFDIQTLFHSMTLFWIETDHLLKRTGESQSKDDRLNVLKLLVARVLTSKNDFPAEYTVEKANSAGCSETLTPTIVLTALFAKRRLILPPVKPNILSKFFPIIAPS